MNLEKTTAASLALALAFTCSALADGVVPVVSNVTMTQPPSHVVKIEYDLANGPAVVTLDIETNGPSGWVSIGLENVYRDHGSVKGDANRKVTAAHGTIYWKAVKAWPDRKIAAGGARAVLTAWPVDDTPDYMVVDMTAGEPSADRVRYYVSTNSLPGGGLFGTNAYRTTHLVLKKIVARDITWTMGSICEFGRTAANEKAHPVTLTNNYYLGVFPVTQKQASMMYGSTLNLSSFTIDGDMRIRDRVLYGVTQPYARGGSNWPLAPESNSLLGKLRTMTGNTVDFDLPSEAQWEYAAKAGHGENDWGDGSPMMCTSEDRNHDATLPGRYLYNQATEGWYVDWHSWYDHASEYGPGDGTPIAGSYRPNSFGLYDMCGGVVEWCLDWFQEDISSYGGAVNADGANALDGSSPTKRVQKGGAWNRVAKDCRPAFRTAQDPSYGGDAQEAGFRVCCRAGLK